MGGRHQGGGAILLGLVAVVLVAASAAAAALSHAATRREGVSDRALAQARAALVAFAADRPIDARVGPGYLPCPDLDGDGWAEPTCGSLSGHLGQDERLGRLPWKTLGLPDLRDGYGERLWYAVSTRYKGLLNCAASEACVDMSPPSAIGTITLRAPSGAVIHDGARADPSAAGGAAAVVIAPGPPLVRRDGHAQRRDCAAPARCDPRDYLDASAGEDNADFHDRSDGAARPGNANGFIGGPVREAGRIAVNDRIAALAYPDVMARVMERVGVELAHCVRLRAAAGDAVPAAAGGRCPAGDAGPGDIPEAALGAPACNAAPGMGWWPAWRAHVAYGRAAPAGLVVVDEGGRAIASGRRFAVLVTRAAGECGAFTCEAGGCTRVARPPRSSTSFDALVASP